MGDGNTGASRDTSGRADPLVGRRLASYEVISRVARGGMGVVYRARHVYIDKIVALKVLDPALSEREDLIERFRTEAQSLARVEHDNVVKVIDILEDKGVHFIVMDFAEGVNLRNLVKEEGPMTGDQLLSVARQTAEALYAAHREGILHRDIKPENLIMNARGRCKLADFGLAGDLRLISEGHEGPLNFGTPAYSAPEVLRRMVPDKRSDIFSFGATLYFLATGEPPFGQTGAQAIMLRQQQGAELLESRRPDLPPKFTQLVMDCLQYHPKNRPGSFTEVMERLPRRMVTRSIPGTPTAPTDTTPLDTGTHESPDAARMHSLVIAAVVVGALAIALVLVLWIAPLLSGGNSSSNEVAPAPDNIAQNRPPANIGGTISNPEPEDPPPAFRPEEEAFNAAELDSRAALSNADYKAAWAAWSEFLKRFPGSEFSQEARTRRAEVRRRVDDLRGQEFEKAKQASDEALREKRTAEALAALDRFPGELLVALGENDEVGVQRKLDTQRQVVVAAEASDLARLLEGAEELRSEWQKDRDNAAALTEIRRFRSAGNLLRERDMLETFLPGRTQETQEKVEKRLAALRKLIEGEHQAAQDVAETWRRFHDETLGDWAEQALKTIAAQRTRLERRDFASALREVESMQTALQAQRSKAASEAAHPVLAQRIQQSEFIHRQVAEYREDLLLANRIFIVVENNLRALRRGNAVREFHVHAGIDDDGERSARLERYSGRVVSVGQDDFIVEDDGRRVTLKYDMLNVASIRRIVGGTESFDEQLTLAVWLVAVGRTDDAATELQKLRRMPQAPEDVIERAQEIHDAQSLAPRALQRLSFVAMRTGRRPWADVYPEGTLMHRLAQAQQNLEGGAAAAAEFIVAASDADPELISLALFAKAVQQSDALEITLRIWVDVLEPLNAGAHAALADRLLRSGDRAGARTAAGRALLLDGSNEAAWKIWSK